MPCYGCKPQTDTQQRMELGAATQPTRQQAERYRAVALGQIDDKHYQPRAQPEHPYGVGSSSIMATMLTHVDPVESLPDPHRGGYAPQKVGNRY